jgi:hypothetical protein
MRQTDPRGGKARAQLYAGFGILMEIAGISYLFGSNWLVGIPTSVLGMFYVARAVTRMLQLSGRLRDPAPWERRR